MEANRRCHTIRNNTRAPCWQTGPALDCARALPPMTPQRPTIRAKECRVSRPQGSPSTWALACGMMKQPTTETNTGTGAHLLGNHAADECGHGGEVPSGRVRERPDDLLVDLRLLGGRLVQALAQREQRVRVRLAVRRRQPPVLLLQTGDSGRKIV